MTSPATSCCSERVTPRYEWFDGWKSSTAAARRVDDLPAAGAALPRPHPRARGHAHRVRERGDAPRPDHRRRVTGGVDVSEQLDAVIVGAGPCGLAAAVAFKRAGLRAAIIDRSCVVSGVAGYPRTSRSSRRPIACRSAACRSSWPPRSRRAATRWRTTGPSPRCSISTCGSTKTSSASAAAMTCSPWNRGRAMAWCARRVPARWSSRRATSATRTCSTCPAKTCRTSRTRSPRVTGRSRQDVVVVGGGNSAVEAALDLYRSGARATIVHFLPQLDHNIKPWVLPDITNRIKDGSIGARFSARVRAITPEHVELETPNGMDRVRADHVYLMVGYQPNAELLVQLGVPIHPEDGHPGARPGDDGDDRAGRVHRRRHRLRQRRQQDVHRERPLPRRSDRPAPRGDAVSAPGPAPTLMPNAHPRRDGETRVAVQAARVHLPVVRDLRRHRLRVGLRPARRRAQEEHQGAVVARHGARRATTSRASTPRSSCTRACGRRAATSPGSSIRSSTARSARGAFAPTTRASRAQRRQPRGAGRRAAEGHAHRAAPVQPDVQDVHGPGRGHRVDRSTCAPRRRRASTSTSSTSSSRRGRRCRSASRRSARRSATRSRPGTSSSGRASSSRWKCSSSSSPARTWRGSSTGRSSAWQWHRGFGLDAARLRFHQHTAEELAHYARAAFDVEFDFGGTLGFQEIEGVHNRGDFDLMRHAGIFGQEARVRRPAATSAGTRPTSIETSVGADRTTLAVLVNAIARKRCPASRRGARCWDPPVAGAAQGRHLSA